MDTPKLFVPGNIVNYVLKNGESRPFIVTRVDPVSANINGIVLFDGPSDAHKLDAELRTDQLRAGTLWLEDIPYAEAIAAKTPLAGTWHLAPAMAAAART